MNQIQPRLIYIAGPGRSGSTLLDLLLGGSEHVSAVGEVHRLNRDARDGCERCTCGYSILDCPFWSAVADEYSRVDGRVPGATALQTADMMIRKDACTRFCDLLERVVILLGKDSLFRLWLKSVSPRSHRRALINSFMWYDAIRKASDRPVVVDSTKDSRRLGLLSLYARMTGSDFRTIFLVRDGRGVAYSAVRRDNVEMATAARNWKREILSAKVTLARVARGGFLLVRYEDLCRDPERELVRVCSFVGIPFDDSMLRIKKENAHNIGGNPMRFRQSETTIVLDEKWRSEVNHSDLRDFDRVAGRTLARLGYTRHLA